MKLNEKSFTPLYQQLVQEIKRAIADGTYKPNDKILTEAELGEAYNVSRVTVRRAINELSSEGYLVKKQGKGTFVAKSKLSRRMIASDAKSFTDICGINGRKNSAVVTKCMHVPAQSDEINFLNLEPDAELLYIQRVLSADNEPIQVENNFFPLDRFRFLEEEDLERESLFKLLQNKYGIVLHGAPETTLEIAKASAQYSKLLNVPVGEPLFFINAYYTGEKGEPLFVDRLYIVGSRYTIYI